MKRLILLLTFLGFSSFVFGQVKPLSLAHSHNDYDRGRPLKDAFANGFTSVEADILYIDGKLYVGHDLPNTPRHGLKRIKKQYLKPLYKRFKQNRGEIYKDYQGNFYLWIDIKMEPQKAYALLRKQLYPYRKMLTYFDNGKLHQGKVTVILSGDRPFDKVLNDDLQLMTLDGRPADLEKNYPTELMPFISEHAGKVCQVKSYDEVDEAAIQLIYRLAEKADAQGKKVRLWATPEDEKLWTILKDAKVGLINTDELERLRRFLEE